MSAIKRGGRGKKVLAPLASNLDVNSSLFLPDRDLSQLSSESKQIIEIMAEKMDLMSKDIISKLEEKNEKISKLEGQVICLKREVKDLSARVDDVEGLQRGDTLIFSGSGIPIEHSDEDCKQLMTDICKEKLKLITPVTEIASIYRIGRKTASQTPTSRSILVKFSNRQIRNYVLSGAKSVKPANVFVNEYLTPVRAKLLSAAKKVKRAAPQYISAVGSRDGRIFAWCKAPDGTSRDSRKFFTNMDDLAEFTEGIHINFSEIIE